MLISTTRLHFFFFFTSLHVCAPPCTPFSAVFHVLVPGMQRVLAPDRIRVGAPAPSPSSLPEDLQAVVQQQPAESERWSRGPNSPSCLHPPVPAVAQGRGSSIKACQSFLAISFLCSAPGAHDLQRAARDLFHSVPHDGVFQCTPLPIRFMKLSTLSVAQW